MAWGRMDPFYAATVHAVEEAVLNATVAADDMTRRDDTSRRRSHTTPTLARREHYAGNLLQIDL